MFVIVCELFRPTYKLNANSPPKNCIDIFVHLYLICVDVSVFDDHLEALHMARQGERI